MTFETIKTFSDSMEAHIMKATLEGHRIECHLVDDNIVSMNPLYSNAVGGIKLKVHSDDLELALKIIHEIEKTPYTDQEEEIIECPKCKSIELEAGHLTARGWFPKIWFFIAVSIGVYPMNDKRVFRCKNCNHEF